MYLKGQKLEVALHSLLSEYKNVQESVLTNVNIQRTGKTSLQMFVYFIFDGSFICRFLYIFRPSSVPRHSICPLQLEAYTLIINDLYLQILHSDGERSIFVGFNVKGRDVSSTVMDIQQILDDRLEMPAGYHSLRTRKISTRSRLSSKR